MPELTSPRTGRFFGNDEIDLIRDMAKHKMLLWTETPFILKSGVPSHIYFQGREDLTDNPTLLSRCGRLIGKRVCELVGNNVEGPPRQPLVIGVPTAANGFAASVTHYDPRSFGIFRPGYRVMREKLKESHGASGHKGFWVNGRPDPSRHVYFTIENVVTSGASLHQALLRIESDGYDTKAMTHLVFIDRQQGGVAKLRHDEYQIETLFELLDAVWVLTQLGEKGWDVDRLAKVENEIRAHQVA